MFLFKQKFGKKEKVKKQKICKKQKNWRKIETNIINDTKVGNGVTFWGIKENNGIYCIEEGKENERREGE